jgi:hypothetical protein
VIEEALKDAAATPAFASHVLSSEPAKGGFATVLYWQELAGERYYDSAGADGRVVR